MNKAPNFRGAGDPTRGNPGRSMSFKAPAGGPIRSAPGDTKGQDGDTNRRMRNIGTQGSAGGPPMKGISAIKS